MFKVRELIQGGLIMSEDGCWSLKFTNVMVVVSAICIGVYGFSF